MGSAWAFSLALPPGLPPACVARLIERLQAGDSDCDVAISACLAELEDTAWAPHLRRAMADVERFDYAAAARLLVGEQLGATLGA